MNIYSIVGAVLLSSVLSSVQVCLGQMEEGPGNHQDRSPRDEVERIKHMERGKVLSLVKVESADTRATISGRFSDPETWTNEQVPGEGSFAYIPEGVRVVVATDYTDITIDRLRVDGELVFSSEVSTGLKVTTLIVGLSGTLEIGTRENPIRRDAPATLILADRGPRDRVGDPMDLTGGILCLGLVRIYGQEMTPIAILADVPMAGDRVLRLVDSAIGWHEGDSILVPGTSFRNEEDEIVRIVSIEDSGKTVVIDPAIRYDRWKPDEIDSPLPVGNMNRSVRIYSENPDPERRGHMMLMHRATGHVIRYAAIESLGRTRTETAHSFPTMDSDGLLIPGSDENTIGRYGIHFHIRNSPNTGEPPHLVEGCVITKSPKHGLVNHGGNVIARDNVTYRIAGSHFFTENGIEMGAFEGNLAVRSSGSGDRVLSREGVHDFGHGGHGFWMQSPLTEVHGNWAFGHAHSGYAYRTTPLKEGGKLVWIAADQVDDPAVINGIRVLKPQGIPIRFSENVAAASENGLVLWDVMSNPKHDIWGVVSGFSAWSLRSRGIWMPYLNQTEIRDVVLIRDRKNYGGIGILDNRTTENIRIVNSHIVGFQIGIKVPRRGMTEVRDCTLGNRVNIQIHNAERHGRRVVIANPEFIDFAGQGSDLDYEFASAEVPTSGNIASLLMRSTILIEGDARLDGSQLYVVEQLPEHIPVTQSENPEIDGLTNEQLWDRYRLAVYGSIAPDDVRSVSFSNGLVGSSAPHSEIVDDGVWPQELRPTGEPQYIARDGEEEGWYIETAMSNGKPETILYYLDATPGYVDLDPRMPRKIHPDDIKYGMEVRTFMYDKVGNVVVAGNGVNVVSGKDIIIDGNIAAVPYTVCDRAGHEATYYYQFEISEDAPRRFRNTSYFRQASMVGAVAERKEFYGPFRKDDLRYLPAKDRTDKSEPVENAESSP